jgi:hypothetical protein
MPLSPSGDHQLCEVAVQFTAHLEPDVREQEALNWFKAEAFKPRQNAAMS